MQGPTSGSHPGFRNGNVLLLSAAGGVLTALSVPAWAYIDPGTGSYVFQIAVATLLGGVFALRLFWSKVKGLLRRRPPSDPDGLS
jgi:hypothetical protein